MNRSKTTIRSIQKNDLELFKSIRLKALKDSPTSFGGTYGEESQWPNEEWQKLIDRMTQNDTEKGFFAIEDNHPVGLIYCYIKKNDPSAGGVGSMWVDPDFRGQGIGRKLLETVIEWAVGHALKKLKLWNTEGNLAAEKLYQSLGFEYSGKRALRKGSELKIREMGKNLGD